MGSSKPRRKAGEAQPESVVDKNGRKLTYKNKLGKKEKYTFETFPWEQVIEMRNNGATKAEIGQAIQLSETAFLEYERKYPMLRELLFMQTKFAIASVENALYKKAVGYEVTETKKIYATKDKVLLEQHETVKHIQPNEQSIEYFLNNRDPERWKNKQTGVVVNNNNISQMNFQLKPREQPTIQVNAQDGQ